MFAKKSSCHRSIALAVLGLLFSFPGVGAAPIDLDSRSNALGNADIYGYVRIVRELGRIDAGNGRDIPIYLNFSSNPQFEPGAFGPGWYFPLLDSTVYEFDDGRLVWEGPDEKRHFFLVDEEADVRRGERAFVHRGMRWRAVVDDRRKHVLISADEDPACAFEFSEGKLSRFRIGADSHAFSIDRNGRGFVRAVIDDTDRDRVLEIEYRGMATPEGLMLNAQRFELEMGEGEMISPDGKTDYGDYRVSFLRRLGTTEYEYARGEDHQHKQRMNEGESRIAEVMVPTNRLTVMDESSGGQSWVEWEAQSGFITADSGATYKVENNAYDPFLNSRRSARNHTRISPEKVAIKRLQEGEEKSEQWSYDWRSGVKTYTDLATGDLIRKTYIMGGGAAHLKLRRVERFAVNNDRLVGGCPGSC